MKKILIKNADWILTMDEKKHRYKNGDLLVSDGRIEKIGTNIVIKEPVDEVINASGKVVLPGFINTHHHFFQALTRNVPELTFGLTLEEWLSVNYGVFQYVDEEELRAAAAACIAELLKTGCTCTADHHYVFTGRENRLIDTEIEVAKQMGIRFHPARGSISIGKSNGNYVPDSMAQSLDDILYDSERLIKKYHDPSKYSMLRIALAPCNGGHDSTPEVLRQTLELARKYEGVRCHSHLAESPADTEIILEKYGCRPVEYMEKIGWLGEDIWYAHCTQLNEEEIRLFAKTGTSVAHCPVSNLQTGVIAPIPKMAEAGVNVGIGVDGSGSNNASNMMTDIRVGYLAHFYKDLDHMLTSRQMLEMATAGGARVLGRDDIGSLEEQKAADLVLLDWNQIQYAGGKNDPEECIVLTGDSKMVDTVMVNGVVRVRGGRLVGMDEERMAYEINATAEKWLKNALSNVC